MKVSKGTIGYGGVTSVVGECQTTPDRHNAQICKPFKGVVNVRNRRWEKNEDTRL